MFWREWIENTTKHHFSQHQLVSCRDLACYSTLHLDNIICSGKSKSTENPLSRFKFFKMKNVMNGIQFSLQGLDVVDCSLFTVE